MTSPTPHDHPDWGRTVSGADIRVLNVAGVQNQLFVSHGVFFVGNLPSLHVAVSVLGGGVQLELFWLDAAVGGNNVGISRVNALANADALGPITVVAPFVEVFTAVDAVGRTIELDIWQTLTEGQSIAGVANAALISVFQDNIPGFTARTYDALTVQWGWGYWTATFDNPASYSVRLQALDYQGTATDIGYIHSANPHAGGVVILPPSPIRILALNNVAAAHVLTVIVTAHPGPL